MKSWWVLQHATCNMLGSLVRVARYGGECGSVGSDWCANGDDHMSGTTQAGPGDSPSGM